MGWSLFGVKCASCGRRARNGVLAPAEASVPPQAMVCGACSARLKSEADARAEAEAKRREVEEANTRTAEAEAKRRHEKRREVEEANARKAEVERRAAPFRSRIKGIERRMQINPNQRDYLPKHLAAGMLLDLVKEVPSSRTDGDYPFDALLDRITYLLEYECGEEHWIGPVFERARSEAHLGYGFIAVNLMLGGPQHGKLLHIFDSIGGPPRSRGVDSTLMAKMVSILDCAQSPHRWVKKAALLALDNLKNWFLEPDQAAKVYVRGSQMAMWGADDLNAWRKSLAQFAQPGVEVSLENESR